jgi:hypothetical protein
LTRRPHEESDRALLAFYLHLLANDLRAGRWERCTVIGWPDNHSADHLLAWSWIDGARRSLIVVNWSPDPAQGRITLDWGDLRGRSWAFTDVLTGTRYERDGGELTWGGLYIERPGWGAHMFRVT